MESIIMTDIEKRKNTIINIIYFGLLCLIAVFALRYALGVCLPFLFAFVLAAVLQKPKNFLVRKTPLKNGVASTLCVLISLCTIVALTVLIGVSLFNELRDFISYFVSQLGDFETIIDKIELWAVGLSQKLPDFLEKTVTENLTSVFESLREAVNGSNDELAKRITESLSGSIDVSWMAGSISGVISTARQLPNIFIAVVITLVSSCFMTVEFSNIIGFIKRQFPAERAGDLSRARLLLTNSLGKMAKAYVIIILITFGEMFIGLSVLRLLGVFESNYILIIAMVTAIVDILPVLGTGTVLGPWALYSLIMGNWALALGLVVIYVVISVIRQIIEPKLVAGQLGLSPLVTIISMYLGLKIFGFLGMFILPLLMIMLKLLNDEGIIHLWKSSAAAEQSEQQPEPAEE